MADWMELAITAVFFFAVLFIYFQFIGPALDSAMGTSSTSTSSTAGTA
jgi:hypothetical protein